MLAEQILLAVLDAQTVHVADVRAALDSLNAPPPPMPPTTARPSPRAMTLEKIAAHAALCVEAQDALNNAVADADGDPDFDAVGDRIDALRPLLAELDGV